MSSLSLHKLLPTILLFFGLGLSSQQVVLASDEGGGSIEPRGPQTWDQPVLSDGRFCEALLVAARRSSLGLIQDAISDLVALHGDIVRSSEIRGGVYDLESEIVKLYSLAPEFRDLAAFGSKWSLTSEQTLDLLSYYALRIFEDIRLAGEQRQVLDRLRRLNVEHTRGFGQSEAALRWRGEKGGDSVEGYPSGSDLGYKDLIETYSVPEIAAAMALSETMVYHDLAALNVSLVEVARERRMKGSRGSPQAERFISHHWGEQRRSVSWSRSAERTPGSGVEQSEDAILLLLKSKGWTEEQIANALNSIFQTEDPSDPFYRTSNSVRKHWAVLEGAGPQAQRSSPHGLQRPQASEVIHEQNQFNHRLVHPHYGLLRRRDGNLVTGGVLPFVYDHAHQDPDSVAAVLGITSDALLRFLNARGVAGFWGLIGQGDASDRSRSQRYLDRYVLQRRVVEDTLDWMVAHDHALPSKLEFVPGVQGKIPHTYDRVVGCGDYRDGGRNGSLRIFDSASEFWKAVRLQGALRSQPVVVSLYELERTRNLELSDEELTQLKNEVLNTVLDWIVDHGGDLPRGSDFVVGKASRDPRGERDHKIPFNYYRLVGRSGVLEEGSPDFGDGPGGALGRGDDASGAEGELRQPQSEVTTKTEKQGLFGGPLAFWLALKESGLKRQPAVPVFLVQVQWKQFVSEALRQIWKQETVEIVAEWIQRKEVSKLTSSCFGKKKDGKIPLLWARVIGRDDYGPSGGLVKNRIFESKDAFFQALDQEMDRRGLVRVQRDQR